jgi:hypothetical protein
MVNAPTATAPTATAPTATASNAKLDDAETSVCFKFFIMAEFVPRRIGVPLHFGNPSLLGVS